MAEDATFNWAMHQSPSGSLGLHTASPTFSGGGEEDDDIRISRITRFAMKLQDGQEWATKHQNAFARYVRWFCARFQAREERTLDTYLLRDGARADRATDNQLTIAEYVMHLFTEGVKGPMLRKAVTELNKCFLLCGSSGVDSLFSTSTNHYLKLALDGGKLTVPEIRVALEKKLEARPAPILPKMQALLRVRMWDHRRWDDDADMIVKGAYVCLMLGLDFGMRPSNLVRGDLRKYGGVKQRNPHYLRMKNLSFVFEGVIPNTSVPCSNTVVPANALKSFIRLAGGQPPWAPALSPVQAIFNIISTKTTSRISAEAQVEAATMTKMLSRRTPVESHHLDAITEWCMRVDGDDDEAVFSRVGTRSRSRRYIRSRDVVGPMRAAAEELGMDPKRFSARSMRVTYATIAAASAVSSAEINDMGWAKGSTVAASTYTRSPVARNTASLISAENADNLDRAIQISYASMNSKRSIQDTSSQDHE